jgi:hypothetical protein
MSGDLAPTRRCNWQFGLRGGMLFVLVLAAVLATVSLKLRQDARFQQALESLASLDMRHAVGGGGLRIECHKSLLSDEDVERLVALLDALRQPHDLGLSAGITVERIDLTRTRISRAAIRRLREAQPQAHIELAR